MNISPSMYLAVYGTLKQGFTNYKRYFKPLIPVFADFVDINFRLYSNGYYPMIIESNVSNKIFIEIYEISDIKLKEIDQLEDPYNYHRQTLSLKDFEYSMEIYVYDFTIPPSGFKLVENGNFESNWDIDDYNLDSPS